MQSKLHLRITRIILFAASLFALIASLIYYFHTQSAELKSSRTALEQLFSTVEGTVAIAAYLDNKELAAEVVESLPKNNIVAAASITSQTGMVVESSTSPDHLISAMSFSVYNPFAPTESVGILRIQPNHVWIEARAQQAALENVFILIAQTLVISVLILFLVQRVLTRPILSIAASLHKVVPGDHYSLTCPQGHEEDEIGNLIGDINKLLASTQSTIEKERILRNQVEELEKHFRLIFERASAGIFLLDSNLHIISANHALKKIVGISSKERRLNKKNTYFPDLFHEPESVRDLLTGNLKSDRQTGCDLRLGSLVKGEERWLHCLFSIVESDDGESLIEGLVVDVTERTFQMERVLFDSEHDPLTKLFNRRAGEQILGVMLTTAKNENTPLALLVVDLNEFKQINDRHGHDAGDKVLVEVANRMQTVMRKEDALIRLGGDEFVIAFVPSGKDFNEVSHIENKLLDQFDAEIILNSDLVVTVGASIGIALFPEDGEDMDVLMAKADSAMYQAKKASSAPLRSDLSCINN